ncbi:hypothetical protein [Streptomyces sp. NPDC059378]|uniref:hypothetical protein n=1 Tax=Streptomyces sp. NPDC059378 TaxID=3346815 RepID=UPI00367E63BF
MSANAGFDVAKEFHWLAVTDDHGRLLLNHRVDNDPGAVTRAIDELHAVEAERSGRSADARPTVPDLRVPARRGPDPRNGRRGSLWLLRSEIRDRSRDLS